MALINGIGTEGPQRPSRIRPRSDSTGWFDPAGAEEEEAPHLAATGTAVSPMAMDGLLALQESVGEVTPREPEQDRRARGHGRRLLGALGSLQHLMLNEADPAPALRQLQDLVEAMPEPATDPALAAVLGAIRMRAAVELARRGL